MATQVPTPVPVTREQALEDALRRILKARQVSHCKHIAKEVLSRISD